MRCCNLCEVPTIFDVEAVFLSWIFFSWNFCDECFSILQKLFGNELPSVRAFQNCAQKLFWPSGCRNNNFKSRSRLTDVTPTRVTQCSLRGSENSAQKGPKNPFTFSSCLATDFLSSLPASRCANHSPRWSSHPV